MQLTNLQARYTDDYPDVIKTKNDIAELEKKIAENDSRTDTNSDKVKTGSIGRAGSDHATASSDSFLRPADCGKGKRPGKNQGADQGLSRAASNRARWSKNSTRN